MILQLYCLGGRVLVPITPPSMVTCSQIVDGGRWKGELAGEQAMKSSRTLVYDTETGTLRYSKTRAALTSRPKSPDSSFKVGDAKLGDNSPAQHKLLAKLHCGVESGTPSTASTISLGAVCHGTSLGDCLKIILCISCLNPRY